MTPTFPESVVDEHRHPRGGPEARANTPDSAGLAVSIWRSSEGGTA